MQKEIKQKMEGTEDLILNIGEEVWLLTSSIAVAELLQRV